MKISLREPTARTKFGGDWITATVTDIRPRPTIRGYSMKVTDLKFDKRNYRKHGDKNRNLIRKSIEEAGLGRSIVIDAENEIIAGNGLVSQLDKNTQLRVVETTGDELVVVKRTDLKTGDAKRKALAIYDNSTSDTSEFDIELLKADFSVKELEEFGLDDIPEDEVDVAEPIEETKEPPKVKITFSYTDSRAVIDAFLAEMAEKYPDLLYTVEIND